MALELEERKRLITGSWPAGNALTRCHSGPDRQSLVSQTILIVLLHDVVILWNGPAVSRCCSVVDVLREGHSMLRGYWR